MDEEKLERIGLAILEIFRKQDLTPKEGYAVVSSIALAILEESMPVKHEEQPYQ